MTLYDKENTGECCGHSARQRVEDGGYLPVSTYILIQVE